jgi:hypothetical protein
VQGNLGLPADPYVTGMRQAAGGLCPNGTTNSFLQWQSLCRRSDI